MNNSDISIAYLTDSYMNGTLTPRKLLDEILHRANLHESHNIWITLLNREQIEPYIEALEAQDPRLLPLYGIPFAIKDNIDLASIPTSAGCPAYTYIPDQSAYCVQKLINAGAIPVGKTNMDQFATGLVGTRSPYGPVHNACNFDYISGGSSSGSAVATALKIVTFSLSTDTAGSGRIPAMLNGIIGIKPSRGRVSLRGVVPACRTLDCVSIFSSNIQDAQLVYSVLNQHDELDSFSRKFTNTNTNCKTIFRFGFIPDKQLQTESHEETKSLYKKAILKLQQLGGIPVEIDFTPFKEAADLLYNGPWVAERYSVISELINNSPETVLPVTRDIIKRGRNYSATDTFRAIYKLHDLLQAANQRMDCIDFMVTPTASSHHRIADVLSDPYSINNQLGYYTNFMNLLDYSAVAIPFSSYSNHLPFGITLFTTAGSDELLLNYASHILNSMNNVPSQNKINAHDNTNYSTDSFTDIFVCGAHMEGLPLNEQLIRAGGTNPRHVYTSPDYRLFALSNDTPLRPGLVKVGKNGASIQGELWRIPINKLGMFLVDIPSPLGLGRVSLETGTEVVGFLCEAWGVNNATDITEYGGWRNFISRTETS